MKLNGIIAVFTLGVGMAQGASSVACGPWNLLEEPSGIVEAVSSFLSKLKVAVAKGDRHEVAGMISSRCWFLRSARSFLFDPTRSLWNSTLRFSRLRSAGSLRSRSQPALGASATRASRSAAESLVQRRSPRHRQNFHDYPGCDARRVKKSARLHAPGHVGGLPDHPRSSAFIGG